MFLRKFLIVFILIVASIYPNEANESKKDDKTSDVAKDDTSKESNSKKETLIETISKYQKLLLHIKASKAPEKKDQDDLKNLAKILLGIVEGSTIEFSKKAKPVIEKLKAKADDLDSKKTNEKNSKNLKLTRDASNIREIIKFLQINSQLLDELYKNDDMIDMLLERCPSSIPNIGSEITRMILILINGENIEESIKEMQEFSMSGEDGTYLMSLLLTYALKEKSEQINFKLLIESNDLNKIEDREYLKIR